MRKLSGKTINSLALCVALAAPLVYLFGALFMALAGAHGTIPFAEPIVTEQYEEVQTYIEDGSTYKLEINQSIEPLLAEQVTYKRDLRLEGIEATINGTHFKAAILKYYTPDGEFFFTETLNNDWTEWARYKANTETYTPKTTLPWIIIGTKLNDIFVELFQPYATLYKSVPTIVGENEPSAGANTAFTFGNFFWHDNFLSVSGREVLNGTPLYGFEPIGELVRYTDANMLHLANLSYGPLVIGYTYYCAHVIIVDLIFYIGSFIPRLIKKTINKLEGGLD